MSLLSESVYALRSIPRPVLIPLGEHDLQIMTPAELLASFAENAGLIPINTKKEQPGYIANSMLVPWHNAALSLVMNGVSRHQDLDDL